MIPISIVHFFVTGAYVTLWITFLKLIAINKPNSSLGKALAFVFF